MIMAKNEILFMTDVMYQHVKIAAGFWTKNLGSTVSCIINNWFWSFLVESPLKQNLLKMVGMKKKRENKNQSKALKKKRNLTHKEWHQA